MQPLKILSFGAGAIGTYVGGSLALAGHKVVFVEQAQAVDLLKQNGLKLDLGLDNRRRGQKEFTLMTPQVEFAGSLAEASRLAPFDAALFALKSYDTPDLLESIRAYSNVIPPILCLQNGVDNEPAIAQLLGSQKVIPGTVTSAIGRLGLGSIVLEKLRGVGITNGHPLSARLAAACNDAYLNPELFANAADMKWSKMLTNLLANPTSAILNLTAAEIFSNPDLYRLEIAQLRECLAVMNALRINIVNLPGTPVRALAMSTKLPIWLSKPFLSKAAGSGRGTKMPSFHIDLHSGRGKSEVSFLHGAVVRSGEKCGVATPVNRIFTDTLLDMTSGKIMLDEYSKNPAKFFGLFGN